MGWFVLRKLLAVLLLGGVFSILGCGSKEGPVAPWLGDRPGHGSDPLSICVDSVSAETSFVHVVTMGSGGVLFVGRDGGYEARSLFRFNVSDTSITQFRESRLILSLNASQELAPVRFLLYRVSSFWNESVVTWERASTDSTGDVLWDCPGGDIFTLPVAEAGPCSLQADTVRVVFTIPAEVTEEIFATGSDDRGFLISLAGEGLAHALWRFESREQALSMRPRFEVGFVDTAGVDTSKVLYAAADASMIQRVSPLDEERLLVGSGYGLRSLIKFPMPAELDSTVTINMAKLFVYCDTTKTFLDTKTMQVELVDSMWQGDSTAVAGGYIGQALAVPGQAKIEFDVSTAVRQWVTGAAENHGLRLRFSVENNAVTYCPIIPWQYGEPGNRPRLEILYTVPPSPPSNRAPPDEDTKPTAKYRPQKTEVSHD